VPLLDGVYACVSVGSVYLRLKVLPHNVILSHISESLFICMGLFSYLWVSLDILPSFASAFSYLRV